MKRPRGRPPTSSPEKRKEDNLKRVQKHRAKVKINRLIMEVIVDRLANPTLFQERRNWLDLLGYINGKTENIDGIYIDYVTPEGDDRSKIGDLSSICSLIAEGNQITKLV